jgi:hypothetical protein
MRRPRSRESALAAVGLAHLIADEALLRQGDKAEALMVQAKAELDAAAEFSNSHR